MTNRLVDYFGVIGVGRRLVLAEEPLFAEEVSLQQLSFKSSLLDRYPLEDYEDVPLSSELPLFCLPGGAKFNTTCKLPSFFTFVFTGGDGSRAYGSVLMFYELLEDDQLYNSLKNVVENIKSENAASKPNFQSNDLTEVDADAEDSTLDEVETRSKAEQLLDILEKNKNHLYVTKSICILSHYPMYSTFKAFLTELYRASLSPCKLPLERYICNFVHEVPLPPLGKVQVQYSIGEKTMMISRAPSNELPSSEVPYEQLFKALSVDNILFLLSCILNERQILLHSTRYSLLGTVSEALCSFIFPFYWHHVYIPLLPKLCLDFITAPVPYIMGTHTSFLQDYEVPSEVVRVNLDTNEVFYNAKIPRLPDHQLSKLRTTLLSYVQDKKNNHEEDNTQLDDAYKMAPRPDEIGDAPVTIKPFSTIEVRMAFFRFFVSLFVKYRTYLRTDAKLDITHFEIDNYFRRPAFLKDRTTDATRQFFKEFFETQAFQRFLLDRLTDDNLSQIKFFDESIQAKINRSKLKLYKVPTPFLNDTSLRIHKTVVAIEPNPTGVPDRTYYVYPLFPSLRTDLFTEPREIKHLVSLSECKSRQCDTILASWKTILATIASLSQQVIQTEEKRFKMLRAHQKRNSKRIVSAFRNGLSSDDFDVDSVSDSATSVSFAGAPLFQSVCSHSAHCLSTVSKFGFECGDICPDCHFELSEMDVRLGWSSSAQDYRTTCSNCLGKFVPRFTVLLIGDEDDTSTTDSVISITNTPSTNGEGSSISPPATPMTPPRKGRHTRSFSSTSTISLTSQRVISRNKYEYLSPVLLKKEIENLLSKDVTADEGLFLNHALIFWNLIVHFKDLSIPINFLLPQVDWKKISKTVNEIRGMPSDPSEKQIIITSNGHTTTTTTTTTTTRDDVSSITI